MRAGAARQRSPARSALLRTRGMMRTLGCRHTPQGPGAPSDAVHRAQAERGRGDGSMRRDRAPASCGELGLGRGSA